MNCEGCVHPIEKCKGEVKRYRVISAEDHDYPNREWLPTNYCENAAQHDIKNGFILIEV